MKKRGFEMSNNPPKPETALETNLYVILDATPISTSDEIHKNYRALSKKYHPDLCADKELGAAKMKEIVAAFNQLKEKESRDLYDSQKIFRFRPYNKARACMNAKPEGFFARLFKKKPNPKDTAKKDQALVERYNTAVSFAKTRKPDSLKMAMVEFQAIQKDQPRNPDLHYNIGLVCYFLGDFVNAVLSFQNALSIDPEFEDAKKMIKSLERN